jgi:DNA-binding response OmpR family regulator
MKKKKILTVDDEPIFIELLKTRLTAAGFDVCSASDGSEAIEKAKSESPHLIVMDVMMPRTSGFEAMQKLRQDPGTKKIPAIIFSGKAGMKDFFEGISDVEFIHKPFDMKLLIGRIETLIGSPLEGKERPRHAILAGVEEPLVNKIRDFLMGHNFQVLVVLNENEAVSLSEKFRPDIVLCQFWEDENILDPRTIAQNLLSKSSTAGTPFFVYCKEALSLEAMKHFKPERIIAYKESSDLLRKLEALALSGPILSA